MILATFKLSSTNALHLGQSKIFSLGKELILLQKLWKQCNPAHFPQDNSRL